MTCRTGTRRAHHDPHRRAHRSDLIDEQRRSKIVGVADFNDCAAGVSGGRSDPIRKSSFFPQDRLPLVFSNSFITR